MAGLNRRRVIPPLHQSNEARVKASLDATAAARVETADLIAQLRAEIAALRAGSVSPGAHTAAVEAVAEAAGAGAGAGPKMSPSAEFYLAAVSNAPARSMRWGAEELLRVDPSAVPAPTAVAAAPAAAAASSPNFEAQRDAIAKVG